MTKQVQADLHVHTTYSDSTFSPEEVIDRAVKVGLTTIAITDHDTIAGIEATRQAGEQHGIEVISGIELSAYDGEEEFHIIGLFVDAFSPDFFERLAVMNQSRHERIYEIVGNLKEMGVALDPEEIIATANGRSPGRLHVAQALLESGYIENLQQAFYRYVGDKCPGNVPKRYMAAEECISGIAEAGGVSILAHPGLTNRDHYIQPFREMGLNGIEALYPSYSEYQTQRYLEMAKTMGLLVSGGSDCHGIRRSDIMLGRIRVPEIFYSKIAAVAELRRKSLKTMEDRS